MLLPSRGGEYRSSEVETELHLELPCILEIRRIRNRSAFRRYKAKLVGAIDVQNAATYKWRRAESDAIHTGLWVVKHVFRIQADRPSQILANSEPLGECHVDTPGSGVLQRVQTDIASGSRRRILKDGFSGLGLGHGLQRAHVPEVRSDCKALGIPDTLERCRVEVAAVELARRAREETPPDFASCVEVEWLDLIGNSTAVKHALCCQSRRTSGGQVHNPAGLPVLEDARQPSRTVACEEFAWSYWQIERAVRIENVRAVGI